MVSNKAHIIEVTDTTKDYEEKSGVVMGAMKIFNVVCKNSQTNEIKVFQYMFDEEDKSIKEKLPKVGSHMTIKEKKFLFIKRGWILDVDENLELLDSYVKK